MCGEGGALLVNRPDWVERAEVIQEKGTNRSKFFRGEVDKYTWVDLGSSYLVSDIGAAFLWAQLEQAPEITARRIAVWEAYHAAFEELENEGRLRRPIVPDHCSHNAHMYYVLWRRAATASGSSSTWPTPVFTRSLTTSRSTRLPPGFATDECMGRSR